MESFYKDKKILVTGAAGSIGREIVKKLLKIDVQKIRILDNNETGLVELVEEVNSDKVEGFFADIRDRKRIKRAVKGVNIVFHAAALKHVSMCEKAPYEAVKTNITGTQNLVECAVEEGIEKFITISTNKAVAPLSVMGATKLICERLTLCANFSSETAFSCVRFGNVLNSRGSVVPLFLEQIRKGGPVKLTCPEMIRFFITPGRAAELIVRVGMKAEGGEIFVLKAKPVRIGDIAEVMIERFAPLFGREPDSIKIIVVGKRKGEKLKEVLFTKEELKHSYETEDMIVIFPPLSKNSPAEKKNFLNENRRHSHISLCQKMELLSKKEIISLLLKEKILPEDERMQVEFKS